MITLDDFFKIEIKIGTILEATKIPEGDKLLKLIFDFGFLEEDKDPSALPQDDLANVLTRQKKDIRQVMSAIAKFYPDPEILIGKQIPVITNLEPRKFKGYESQGMIIAGHDDQGLILLTPERLVKSGIKLH